MILSALQTLHHQMAGSLIE